MGTPPIPPGHFRLYPVIEGRIYEGLRARAKKNMRSLRGEVQAIVRDVIEAEELKEQPKEEVILS